MENQQSFWQFSDQLRLQSSGNEEVSNNWSLGSSYLNNFANLSINENVWSNSNKANGVPNLPVNENPWSNLSKASGVSNLPANENIWSNSSKGNFPINEKVWANSNKGNNNVSSIPINDTVWGNSNKWNKAETRRNLDVKGGKSKQKGSDLNGFNEGWKVGGTGNYGGKGIGNNNNNKSSENSKNNNSSNKNNRGNNATVDKRFKTLPPSESLPRTETLGGYIFVCNNDTMEDDLRRQLFGLPQRYRDSVRAITPGLPLFLYNYSTHQLHGVFEAASFGGTNIDPTAWEDKKCPGGSRFPAQVRVVTRKGCTPLEEDSFRPVLHHYDGPKFRLQLNIPEALALLDIFEDNNP